MDIVAEIRAELHLDEAANAPHRSRLHERLKLLIERYEAATPPAPSPSGPQTTAPSGQTIDAGKE